MWNCLFRCRADEKTEKESDQRIRQAHAPEGLADSVAFDQRVRDRCRDDRRSAHPPRDQTGSQAFFIREKADCVAETGGIGKVLRKAAEDAVDQVQLKNARRLPGESEADTEKHNADAGDPFCPATVRKIAAEDHRNRPHRGIDRESHHDVWYRPSPQFRQWACKNAERIDNTGTQQNPHRAYQHHPTICFFLHYCSPLSDFFYFLKRLA